MKKIIALLLVLIIAITAFAGCGEKSKLPDIGSTKDILGKINETVDVDIKMTMDGNVLDGLPTYGFGDLTKEEFAKLVVEGDYTASAIRAQYHHIIVMKFANSNDAFAYKESIAKTIKEFPYVCGTPDAYYVNDSAEYVFLAITFEKEIDKYAKAFEDLAGKLGKEISGIID